MMVAIGMGRDNIALAEAIALTSMERGGVIIVTKEAKNVFTQENNTYAFKSITPQHLYLIAPIDLGFEKPKKLKFRETPNSSKFHR